MYGLIPCLIIPLVTLLVIFLVCKYYNFSVIPKGLKIPTPKKFRFPKIKRNEYTWEVESSDDETSDESDSE